MMSNSDTLEPTPREHALLFALLAREAIQQAGEARGAEIVRRAVWRYGSERGRRMALRAEADGQPLDWLSFMAYGEWRAPQGWHRSENLAMTPHLEHRAILCPWHQAWLDSDLLPYGRHYCLTIDVAIVHGFSPALTLVVGGTLSNGASACEFSYRDAQLTPERQARLDALRAALGQRMVQPWAYHLAHLYHSVGAVMAEELGEAGRVGCEAALKEFAARVGSGVVEQMRAYAGADFSHP